VGHHGHFGGGTISWIPIGTTGEVQFSVIDGFRRSGHVLEEQEKQQWQWWTRNVRII